MARATEIMERKKSEKEAEMRRLRAERAERDRIRFGSVGARSVWWKPEEKGAEKEKDGVTEEGQKETLNGEDIGSGRSQGGG